MRLTASTLAALLLVIQPAAAQTAAEEAAESLVVAGRWAEAVTAFTDLVASSPTDGRRHFYLGVAWSRLGQCDRAEPALRASVALGVSGGSGGVRQARVMIAGCAALRGDTSAALVQLDTAWRRDGLRDFTLITAGPRFASLLGLERYRAMAGIPAPPLADRAARWRFDLAWLDRLVRETHPDPFHAVSDREWTAEVARLHEQVPALSDDQVIAGMMRLLARVGDGHTALYPRTEGPGAWNLLPIWPVALADGWHVGAAAPAWRSLVGGRIVGAGGRDIAALDSLARTMLAADNVWTALWLAQIPLQLAQFYQLAGAANPDGSVTLRVEHGDGRIAEATLPPGPLDRDPNARWAPRDWPAISGAAPPRWIRHADAWAAIEWLPRERVFYVALNMVRDTVGRSLASLGAALRDSVSARRADGIVLDLRLNNGGNYTLVPSFLLPLLALPQLQQNGAFQILTGPRTFSASAFLIADLWRFTEGERVGWPTGARPVVYSTENPFRLPLSGLTGAISARLEVAGRDASDARPTFPPNVTVWPTGAALRRGEDPVLEAALARIASRAR